MFDISELCTIILSYKISSNLDNFNVLFYAGLSIIVLTPLSFNFDNLNVLFLYMLEHNSFNIILPNNLVICKLSLQA
jgi:hypothetical protein